MRLLDGFFDLWHTDRSIETGIQKLKFPLFFRMQKSCRQCSVSFEIMKEDQRFLDLFAVPAPTMCPDCRLQRRLCERNTRSLYYRKCDLTGQQIISQYNTDLPFPVYGVDAWAGDQWDGLTYGRDIDWNRPFFEQFQELLNATPHLALFNTPGTMENSDYNNATGYLKNCYLICESDICEDCYYSNLLKNGKRPAGWTLDRDPFLLETNVAGVFAVGDVRDGAVRRVANSVGEGSIVLHFVRQYLANR